MQNEKLEPIEKYEIKAQFITFTFKYVIHPPKIQTRNRYLLAKLS